MSETPELELAACNIEFLNGDGSYVVTVFYRTTQGQGVGAPDRFTFSTPAKLRKFINKTLLASPEVTE